MTHPRPTSLRAALAATLLTLLPGCGTYWIPFRSADPNPDQPWFGADGRARAYYEVHTDMVVRRDETLHWARSDFSYRTSAHQVAYDCNAYLQSRGIEHAPEKLMADGSPLPPRTDGQYASAPLLRFDVTARIVCLDPVIVLLVPIPDNIDMRRREHYGILATGYTGSTRIPYHPDLQWFSPTLNRGPESATPIPDSNPEQRQIETRWGALILTHAAGEWVVTTQPRREAQESQVRMKP